MTWKACAHVLVFFLLVGSAFAQSAGEAEYAELSAAESPSAAVDGNSLPISETGETPAQIDERLLPIGDGQPVDDEESVAPRAIGFGDVVRMLLILAAVIGIIYITFTLLKKASSRSQIQSSSVIHNVSTMSLGGNKALHIVKIGARYYMIGSGDQGVQLIEVIEDDETVEYIRQNQDQNSNTVQKNSFRTRIRSLLSAVQKPSSRSPRNLSTMIDSISRSRRRLKDM